MKVVALTSFGKDSLYASYLYGKVDLFLMNELNFPRPSPHVVNIEIAKEIAKSIGVPMKKIKLRKGHEKEDLANFLSQYDKVIAGNIFLEEHRKWLESVSKMAGVNYEEPIWGMKTESLLKRIISDGFEAMIVGIDTTKLPPDLLGKIIDEEVAEIIIESGIDPCGEYGEYHTMVLNSPMHRWRVDVEEERRYDYGGYAILKARVCKSA
jgi:diphthine-ammonia ligase